MPCIVLNTIILVFIYIHTHTYIHVLYLWLAIPYLAVETERRDRIASLSTVQIHLQVASSKHSY